MSIEIHDMRVRYGSVEAVRGISFRIDPGEVCGYVGPNGAGKTSTVKVLAGLLQASAGQAEVSGLDVATRRREVQRRLGFVPEGAPTYPVLTSREFLDLVGHLHELPPATLEARREFLLERFELGSLADRPTGTLSRGQRQRLVLIAALLHGPDVLVLDEPLNGLDANAGRIVKDVVQGLAASGCTVLFCTHTLEVVERLCTRVIILNQGRIVADGPTAHVVARSPDQTLEGLFAEITGHRPEREAAAIVAAVRPKEVP